MNLACGPLTNDCVFSLPSRCVIYDGPNTSNIGYISGMRLTDLLLLIDSKLGGASSGVFVEDSTSIDIIGLGLSSSPYIFNAIISQQVGNGLSILPDGLYAAASTPPDLQTVTNIDNETSNLIVVTGSDNAAGHGEGLYLSHVPATGSSIASFDPVSGYFYGSLLFTTSGVSLSSQSNSGVGRLMTIVSSGTGGGMEINSETISMMFTDLSFSSLGNSPIFNTTVVGLPAANPNEFVTLSQLNGITNFYTADGTLTGNRIVDGNTNTLTFDDISQFTINSTAYSWSNAATGAGIGYDGLGLGITSGNGAGVSIFAGTGMTIAIGAVVESNVSVLFPGLPNPGGQFLTTDVNGKLGLATVTIPSTPNLQAVTTVGNKTTNSVFVTGSSMFPTSGKGVLLVGGASPGIIGYDADLGTQNLPFGMNMGSLVLNCVTPSAASQINVVGSLTISSQETLALTSLNPMTFYVTDNINPGNDHASFEDGSGGRVRVKIKAGVDPEDGVTVAQLNATAPTIATGGVASATITQAYMNTNYASIPVGSSVWFINLSDDATKVLVVNRTGASTWSANADTKLT